MIVYESGICRCIAAPMGDNGLEGYIEDELYQYELVEMKSGKQHARIYHDPEYAETCGIKVFSRYFKIESDAKI